MPKLIRVKTATITPVQALKMKKPALRLAMKQERVNGLDRYQVKLTTPFDDTAAAEIYSATALDLEGPNFGRRRAIFLIGLINRRACQLQHQASLSETTGEQHE